MASGRRGQPLIEPGSTSQGHNNVIVGSGVLHTHLRRRWGPTDALLHGVQETCARSRAGLGQILAPRTVFSHREPSKIG